MKTEFLAAVPAFVELNPAPARIGIALAPFHLQQIQASVEEAIRLAGPQLRFSYAWQKEEKLGQLPGEGPADFGPWLRALARTNYRGYLAPYAHGNSPPEETSAALTRARDYLRRCHAQATTS